MTREEIAKYREQINVAKGESIARAKNNEKVLREIDQILGKLTPELIATLKSYGVNTEELFSFNGERFCKDVGYREETLQSLEKSSTTLENVFKKLMGIE